MNAHAMKYVSMSRRVREGLSDEAPDDLRAEFGDVESELLRAEQALVRAYGHFRLTLRAAVPYSSLAESYLEATTWDLT